MVSVTTPVARATICQPGKVSIVGHSDAITYMRTSFVEAEGKVEASVLRPDGEERIPAVIISYSAITPENKTADMFLFAQALARAGAAAIVLGGTLALPPSENNTERTHHLVGCAAEWLVQNAKIDGERVATIAPESSGKVGVMLTRSAVPAVIPA